MAEYETKKIFSSNLTRLLAEKKETQLELSSLMGVAPSSVSAWCNGDKMPRMDKIEWLARHFGVNRSALLEKQPTLPSGCFPIHMNKIPLVGSIACGTPILASENIEEHVDIPDDIRADFALRCKGDSMLGIKVQIHDGDVVYIRKQDDVDNGTIAAVLIGDEATLKRVYKKKGKLILQPENPDYEPLVYIDQELEDIRIIGKAVAFMSKIE